MHHSPWELWANRAVIYSQGGGRPNPQNTQSSPHTHTAHDILFRVFGFCNPAAILARKQQVFIVKQQVLVFIMINSICLQIQKMPHPPWCIYGSLLEDERSKGREIPMNSILEVISISSFLDLGIV